MIKRTGTFLLILAILWSLLAGTVSALGEDIAIDRSQALAKLSEYNQVFTAMGSSSKDSMPLGNGSMAANVWVESDGELVCYLSRCDAYSEATRLLKVGRIRIGAVYEDGTNVFAAGTPFRQELVLEEGAIYITAGSGDRGGVLPAVD